MSDNPYTLYKNYLSKNGIGVGYYIRYKEKIIYYTLPDGNIWFKYELPVVYSWYADVLIKVKTMSEEELFLELL